MRHSRSRRDGAFDRRSPDLRPVQALVTFLLANPDGLAIDEHPYVRLLSQDLLDAGIAPVALRIP